MNPFTGYELRVTSCGLRVAGYWLKIRHLKLDTGCLKLNPEPGV